MRRIEVRRRTVGWVLCAALLVIAAACAGGRSADDSHAPLYRAVLQEVMRSPRPVPGPGPGETPVIFLESLGEGFVIDLGVQADLVEAMEDVAKVRFIDRRSEAVEEDLDDEPVRDGGVLVSLGPLVDAPDGTASLRLRVYYAKSLSEDLVAVVSPTATGWTAALS